MDEVTLNSPIGSIKIVHTVKGVHEITLDTDSCFNNETNVLNLTLPQQNDKYLEVSSFTGPHFKSTEETIKWIQEYFCPKQHQTIENKLPPLDNNLFNNKTFTSRVLKKLYCDILPGRRISYKELAKLCGSPKACRAVGQAMRSNPVPLIVPCHRVISSDGTPGPYMRGKGDNIKKWLLYYESKNRK